MKTFNSERVAVVLVLVGSCSAFLTPNQRISSHKPSTTERFFFNFGKDDKKAEAKVETPQPPTTEQDEPDLVEKIFTVFFGKPEAEPLGLKRFGKERFPEQYPATIDEWADPVTGDNKEVAIVRPVLKNTNLEYRGLTLTYAASRDGWDATKFHRLVDKKGPALVVCTTQSGTICGGYNPKGWVGYGEARGSIAAFLFRQNSNGSFTKLRKVGGAGLAQMDNPESGPSFGPDALVIPLGRENPRIARSKLGSYYERFPDGTNSLFGKQSSVVLKDMKVYHGVWGPDEYIPFTDAEPFALY